VVYSEPARVGKRIRYAHQHVDGRIYLWTDDHELIALSAEENTATDEYIDEAIERLSEEEDRRREIRAAIEGCQECHSFETGIHEGAPSLGDVFGREIGATPFRAYSQGLLETGGTWSAESLAAYIADPQAFAPGTTMPRSGLEDEEVVSAVAD